MLAVRRAPMAPAPKATKTVAVVTESPALATSTTDHCPVPDGRQPQPSASSPGAMPNPNGNPAALVPAPVGNTRGLKHGAYSQRPDEARVAEIVTELMALPHVSELDLPAAREIAHLTLLAERCDAALANGRVENRRGQLRALVDQRRRLSAQLLKLYEAFGMTPE